MSLNESALAFIPSVRGWRRCARHWRSKTARRFVERTLRWLFPVVAQHIVRHRRQFFVRLGRFEATQNVESDAQIGLCKYRSSPTRPTRHHAETDKQLAFAAQSKWHTLDDSNTARVPSSRPRTAQRSTFSELQSNWTSSNASAVRARAPSHEGAYSRPPLTMLFLRAFEQTFACLVFALNTQIL
jgi:hypothetical protein